jgi:hypothetical protein
MTLIQFFVNFLKPYADMPEFTTCVMKALEELGHTVTGESFYEESGPISQAVYDKVSTKRCSIAGKEAHNIIIDELCDE